MDRRTFLATSATGLIAGTGCGGAPEPAAGASPSIRALFPRVARETFLNGAGGTPLGTFAESGIRRYLEYLRLGPTDGRRAYADAVWSGVRARFAALVGAGESEIGLVECTKAGEQLLLDGLPALRRGGNVVTNDRTALVAVSLVSNVNGRIEPVAELARLAHERGALLYADIIQAAGAIPIDLHALGVDVAASSSYKWLFGIHGAGFVYVRQEVQGSALPDHLFPGHVQRNYPPWVDAPTSGIGDYRYAEPTSAVRYQPGHVSYVGYAAAYEALGFLERIGGAAAVQAHATTLNARLLAALDPEAYRVLTPEPDRSPILALQPAAMTGLAERLAAARVVVGVGGDMPRLLRISPAIYNTEQDVDRLAEVLRA